MISLTDIPRNKNGSLNRTALKELSNAGRLRGIDLAGQDLSGQKLADLDLTGANLTDAYLTVADLTGAILRGANLYQADLTGANLLRADLTGANLLRADLARANLTDANLANTNPQQADLRLADLRLADLTDANLSYATLSNDEFNIHEVVGLDLSHEGILARGAICCSPNDLRVRFPDCWAAHAAADGHNQEVQDMIAAFAKQDDVGSYAESLLTVLAVLGPSR